ncbi:MAG: hypothetical protein AMXMBFR58_30040 [Phycisphaerae bacterium]
MGRLPTGQVPNLRQHKRGHWFVRVNGKDVYLSAERDRAVSKYIELFGQAPPSVFGAAAELQAVEQELAVALSPPGLKRSRLVRDAAEQLYLMVDGQTTSLSQSNIRADLKLFLERFGSRQLHTLQPDDLLDFRRRLLTGGWAVRTVNQRMQATRRLLRFCWEMGYAASPFRLGPLKALALPPTRSRASTRLPHRLASLSAE